MSAFTRSRLHAALSVVTTNDRLLADPNHVVDQLLSYGDAVVEGSAELIVTLRMQAMGIDFTADPPHAFLCRELVMSGYRFGAFMLNLVPRSGSYVLVDEVDRFVTTWQGVGWGIQKEWFDPIPGPDDDWQENDDELALLERRERGWMPHQDLTNDAQWFSRLLADSMFTAAGGVIEIRDEIVDDRMAMVMLWFNDGLVLAAADWHLVQTGTR